MVNYKRRGTVHGSLAEISANRVYSTRLAIKSNKSEDQSDGKNVQALKFPCIAMLRKSMQNLKISVDHLQKNKLSLVKPKSKSLNVLVLGAKNVGKSALIVRFLTRRFIGDYMSGEDQRYEHTATHLKNHVNVVFLDTSDSESNVGSDNVVDEKKLAWADGIIVVYDVGNLLTFEYAQGVIKALCKKSSENSDSASLPLTRRNETVYSQKIYKNFRNKPLLLIGNKADLWHNRRVTVLEGQSIACKYHDILDYEELSAAEGYDAVQKCINGLLTKVTKSKNGRSLSL
uniref:small monomeric GTPase n=1 Tax=Phallusia mammillata TaxID=59560 RepID=A0A6F9DRJ5_9ASCI|nr:ras-related and estrogen-regulated growth inhibitor-like protein [Phallusia mammillata]